MGVTTVGELGESGVLARVLAELSDAEAALLGPGDDSAVLNLSGNLVVTSDTMIEGPDFRLAWHSGFELGWKLAVTNLSDVAAMGARPVGLTVSFACPESTPARLLAEIAAGLDAACREFAPGCGVVGGDLGRAPVLVAAVTALGDMEGRAPVTRQGASAGDVLAYAGDLGLAGIGLSLLFKHCADELGTALSEGVDAQRAEHPSAIEAQLRPRSPIHLGVTASERGATAMMDVSDGLTRDVDRMARASGVSINLDSVALREAFGTQRGEVVSIEAMLFGGEDHGMLATFPAGARLPEGFAAIGAVQDEVSGTTVLLDGEPCEPRGWDPFTFVT